MVNNCNLDLSLVDCFHLDVSFQVSGFTGCLLSQKIKLLTSYEMFAPVSGLILSIRSFFTVVFSYRAYGHASPGC